MWSCHITHNVVYKIGYSVKFNINIITNPCYCVFYSFFYFSTPERLAHGGLLWSLDIEIVSEYDQEIPQLQTADAP